MSLPPIARSTDPVTSHIAAQNFSKRQTQMDLVLAWVQKQPGETAGTYGELTGLGHVSAQRRLSDLKNQKLSFLGEAQLWQGNKQKTWWPRPQGRLL